eukprot:TRINITY_DN1125_c0_g2_i11.p1 TRINITY_DN1125_c0_g2~~TRINITY_DN1125_c0_g2_i11.p1  ORF type:complete len:179 (+),score=26.82 TRINITY_DN1125_c0_g2_i11:65-601(+)
MQATKQRKIYKLINDEERELFIKRVLTEDRTMIEIAAEMGIKLCTGKAIMRVYRREGRLLKKRKHFQEKFKAQPIMNKKIKCEDDHHEESLTSKLETPEREDDKNKEYLNTLNQVLLSLANPPVLKMNFSNPLIGHRPNDIYYPHPTSFQHNVLRAFNLNQYYLNLGQALSFQPGFYL